MRIDDDEDVDQVPPPEAGSDVAGRGHHAASIGTRWSAPAGRSGRAAALADSIGDPHDVAPSRARACTRTMCAPPRTAAVDRGGRSPSRAPPAARSPSAAVQERLARRPDEQRPVRAPPASGRRASSSSCARPLREPEAGIEDERLARHAGRARPSPTLVPELGGDLADHVGVAAPPGTSSRDRPRVCISTSAAPAARRPRPRARDHTAGR